VKPFVDLDGLVVPVNSSNIDTDILVPRQYLKRVERTGLADYLFDRWRYLDRGKATDDPYVDCSTRQPDPDFILNRTSLRDATILLTRANFGCGSSREQAVWALSQWGFRAVIAPSFGDIFFNNCFSSGLLPIVLSETAVDDLFAAAGQGSLRLFIDLPSQCVRHGDGQQWPFDIDHFRKANLLQGNDAVALTLKEEGAIRQFEHRHFNRQPWLAAQTPRF
jgi:3-isopropylmalate/(R)-2-methylmalate dehydratase small subunit